MVRGEPRAVLRREDYEDGVRVLQRAIREGEIFQAILSQRWEQPFTGDPFTLYRALRLTNPAPHMFFFPGEEVTLVGSSPERLVSVRSGRVQYVPMAGTRPRHDDEEEDDRLGRELLGDVKERAEHDMLVDLARNDLGRVARIGSVTVKDHAVLERFARVQHLVSRVECDLAPDRDAIDALAACFPAGTVSGAPKVRAMELIAELEPETRGPYAGAFGHIGGAGTMDMALVIRTLAVRGEMIHTQSGAGIVHDSVPEREFEETGHKASALFEAARLAGSDAFVPTAGHLIGGSP
jgi:anthranilate synthase component 1